VSALHLPASLHHTETRLPFGLADVTEALDLGLLEPAISEVKSRGEVSKSYIAVLGSSLSLFVPLQFSPFLPVVDQVGYLKVVALLSGPDPLVRHFHGPVVRPLLRDLQAPDRLVPEVLGFLYLRLPPPDRVFLLRVGG
jgi:hypothetical protein